MKIWLMNNYCTLPQHGALARTYYFGKCLYDMGYEPILFIGSHPHNTDLQLIQDNRPFAFTEDAGFPCCYVKTNNYESSKLKRVISMFEFYINAKKAAKEACQQFGVPDVILGSSAHPLTPVLAIRLAKKYGIKAIAEVRDLWPESIVEYGVASKKNPVIKLLYRLEKRIYTKADAIIFTMEGGKDYIIEQGWDTAHGGPVDLNKVHHINNGVDLDVFDYNKEHYQIEDLDLDNPDTFKAIYAGSVRKVNDLGILLEAAKKIKDQYKIKILIYGDGDEREKLAKEAKQAGLDNIVFKGRVSKEQVPYILSKADLCLLHWKPTPITKFGMSMNKLFEYAAAKKPILSNSVAGYDLIQKYGCGIAENVNTAEDYAKQILSFSEMETEQRVIYGERAQKLAKDHSFLRLTEMLIQTIEEQV